LTNFLQHLKQFFSLDLLLLLQHPLVFQESQLLSRLNDEAEKQADVEEEVKGPAKKIALDAEGNWSKAAQGFVRGQGVTTEDIVFKE
jgi:hypothetical protein